MKRSWENSQAVPANRSADRSMSSVLSVFSMNSPLYELSGLPALLFFTPRNRTPFSPATFTTMSSRLWMALWALDATPILYPFSISATMR